VEKLADTALWDHRNSVNQDNDTATLSIETNLNIKAEYCTGVLGLEQESKKPQPKPQATLLKQKLGELAPCNRGCTEPR